MTGAALDTAGGQSGDGTGVPTRSTSPPGPATPSSVPSASPDSTLSPPASDFSDQPSKSLRDVESGNDEAPATDYTGPSGGDWFGVVGWLLAIMALIYVVAVIFRRLAPGATRMFNSRAMKVLARTYVSPKQSLLLVEIGNRLLVLAHSSESITRVSEITEPDELDLIRQITSDEGAQSVSTNFRDIFRRSEQRTTESAREGTTESLDGLKGELDDLLRKTNEWRRRHGSES